MFDKRGFIAPLPSVPSVDAQRIEIALLPLGTPGTGHEVLRLVARRIASAVQFEPSQRPNIRCGHSFPYSVRNVKLDEACDDPSGDRDGLITGLRCSRRSRSLRRDFAGRTSSDPSDQEPVFFLRFWRLARGLLLVGDLNPIGNGAPHDLNRGTTDELIEARVVAPGFNAQIGLHLGPAAGLDRQRAHIGEKLCAALPNPRLPKRSSINPAVGA